MSDINDTPDTNQQPEASGEPTVQMALHDVTALERGKINNLADGKTVLTRTAYHDRSRLRHPDPVQ